MSVSPSPRIRATRGQLNLVKATAPASTVLSIGDLVYQEVTAQDIKTADQIGWGSLAAAQEAFHDLFLGIAQDQRDVRQTVIGNVMVATTGVFTCPCTALGDSLGVGVLVGVAESDATGSLHNQKVVEVATVNLAIGRTAAPAAAGATTLQVEIVSTVLFGGPQAVA